MSDEEKRPYGKKPFGKKPFEKKPFGKKPLGKKSFGGPRPAGEGPRGTTSRPRPLSEGESAPRPPRREFSDRPKRRDFGDRPYGGPGGGKPRFDRKPPFRDDREQDQGGARPHLGDDELRYLGKNACLALFQKRPNDIIRIYVQRELASEYKPLIEWCTANRKSFHLVDSPDLERLTDSVHHQGICVVAKARRFDSEKYFFNQLGSGRTLVLYLDGVGNPHNLGAVLRTAAHFGVSQVCVPAEELSRISPAIYRTAEGAAEVVSIVRVDDPEKFLDRLQGLGFHLYAFEAPNSQSVFDTRLNEKSVFVFGSEVEGISGIVREVVETKLAIPGTGAVESLNVSVAAAIAMAEFNRQAQQKSVRIVKNKP